jgi:hypothetical protein
MHRGSLTIVGTGIKAIAHMTSEAQEALRSADEVLYGTCESLTESWIVRNAKRSESLDVLYADGEPRMNAYQAMIDKILTRVRSGLRVCLSFEGHPGVFVYVSHESARLARAEDYHVRMLPGISTQGSLVCDLLVDPAACGCQSFDATDFLLRGYQPDVTRAPPHGLISSLVAVGSEAPGAACALCASTRVLAGGPGAQAGHPSERMGWRRTHPRLPHHTRRAGIAESRDPPSSGAVVLGP